MRPPGEPNDLTNFGRIFASQGARQSRSGMDVADEDSTIVESLFIDGVEWGPDMELNNSPFDGNYGPKFGEIMGSIIFGSISATIRSAKPRYRNRVSVAASDSKSSPAASMIDRQTC